MNVLENMNLTSFFFDISIIAEIYFSLQNWVTKNQSLEMGLDYLLSVDKHGMTFPCYNYLRP